MTTMDFVLYYASCFIGGLLLTRSFSGAIGTTLAGLAFDYALVRARRPR